MKKTDKLREIIKKNELTVVPGAPNAITARLIEQSGFPVVYVSGAGVANTLLGVPDVGLVTMTEMVNQVRYIANATTIPVIADADTGYGNAINLVRTVQEFEQAGAAGIQIEDQIAPKKCGHFEGKDIVSLEEMVGKIKATVDTRKDPNFIIIARTDARAVENLEAAIERANAYHAAGADMIFVEAPQSIEELQYIAKHVNAPLVANMVEHGKTPILTYEELDAMGYNLVLYANMAMRTGIKAMEKALGLLKQNGSSLGIEDNMITMKERNAITDKKRFEKLETEYLTLA